MRKRMAGVALAASLLAALPVSSAQAQELHCLPFLPDNPGCLVRCMVNWHVDFVFSGGEHPGYACAHIT